MGVDQSLEVLEEVCQHFDVISGMVSDFMIGRGVWRQAEPAGPSSFLPQAQWQMAGPSVGRVGGLI